MDRDAVTSLGRCIRANSNTRRSFDNDAFKAYQQSAITDARKNQRWAKSLLKFFHGQNFFTFLSHLPGHLLLHRFPLLANFPFLPFPRGQRRPCSGRRRE